MLITTDYSDLTPDVTQTYDNFGRPLQVSNTVSTTTYAYDPNTLVLDTETISHDLDTDGTPDIARVLDRSQDGLLRPDGWQLKDGANVDHEVSYGYDNAGRLKYVDPSYPLPQAPAFTYSYETDTYDLVENVTGPTHTVTNTWEATRNVLGSKENEAGATDISTFTYGVNEIGQRTSLTTVGTGFDGSSFASATATGPAYGWSYNSRGELVEASDTGTADNDRAYQYDGIGNREKTVDGLFTDLSTAPVNYVANSLNQYTSVPSVASAPSYDDDGNATAYPVPAAPTGNSTLVWDAENRLKSITVGSTTTTYRYDSQSRRISKKVGSGTSTVYFYDGWNPIAEYSGTTLVKGYLWGMDLMSGSMQGAGGVGGFLAVNDGSATYYPTYDGNGNVSEYLDSTGAVVAHYEYDPFGNTTVSTGTKAADFSHRFSTKPLDAETGLYYYGYRYYDPATGRWPSRDPIEEAGGVNIYAFVFNNSYFWYDYLGREPRDQREETRRQRNQANDEGHVNNQLTDRNSVSNKDVNKGIDHASRMGNGKGDALAAAEYAEDAARRGADNSSMESARSSCELLLANSKCKGAECPNSCEITFRRRFNPGGTPLGNEFVNSSPRPCKSCGQADDPSDGHSMSSAGGPGLGRYKIKVKGIGIIPPIYEDETSSFNISITCIDVVIE